ncbi:MAG: SRPBCC family protein [Cyclobacteriaceae bacterium]
MPKLAISKSILIDAPVSKVFDIVSDFNQWTVWSPWLLMDPDTKVTVAEDKQSYEWDGKRTGKGNMKITSSAENKSVNYDLTFLTPWKSFAKVAFELEEKDGKTEATWIMDSSLPWFMFWMKKMMTAFVGMDYERGLRLLKDYAEDGKTHSDLHFLGESTKPGCAYIGIKTTASISNMSDMGASFEKLMALVTEGDLLAGEPFSQYHKWDMVKGMATYTAAIPVKAIPENLPDGVISGTLPDTKVYTLKHTGPYHHLGNAWSTLYNMQRGKEFKLNKKVDPFESYVNSPMEVDEKQLVTEVHFPVK